MTNASTARSTVSTPTEHHPDSFTGLTVLLLYLGPGLVLTGFYVLVAPLLLATGLPAVWGLLIGILVVIVPLEGGIVLYARRRSTDLLLPGVRVSSGRPLSFRQYLWLVPITVLAAFLLPGIAVPFEPWLRTTVFAWLPAWFSAGLTGLDTYPATIQWGTVVLWIVAAVLLGPIVEELYFRGFLLPRTAHGTWIAPPINALLFAVYHFWQPYAVVTIALFALPLAYVVWWRKNVMLSIIAHCTINLLTFLALFAGIMQR